MDALTIDRARSSMRLRPSQLEHRRAIERIHERVIREALEPAWAGIGESSGDELICVRSLAIELHLDSRALGAAAAQRWSEALVAELRRTLREGDPRRVVRYPSPSAALVDMGMSLAREDLRRAWAWVQLGFVDATELRPADRVHGEAAGASITLAGVHRSFVRALWARPELIVGVITRLARAPETFARLLRSVAGTSWTELCAAALRVHGVADPIDLPDLADLPDLLDLADMSGASGMRTPDMRTPGAPASSLISWLTSIAASSPIVHALRSPHVDASSAWALLLLAVLDAAPMSARRLASKRGAAVPEGAPREPRREPDPRRADPRLPAEPEPERLAAPPTELPLEPWREPASDARARGRSEWGGLALTLAILRDEQLWPELDELALSLELEFRVVLHGLGRALVAAPIDAGDPALLAFIGLPPDAPPPAELTPVRERVLAAALEAPRAHLLAALHDRLGGARPERRALLRRRVEVVGEPGWLELHFDLRDVDLDIRRAGLDLNPDWIPELGVVMRFSYA